jgi:stage III sporulation protein SpoIIIAA
MLQVAQQHQPDVLVVGELSTQQEVAAAVRISRSCNVLLVAAAPASDLNEVLQDSDLCQLLGLRGVEHTQRARLSSFSLAVEVQDGSR